MQIEHCIKVAKDVLNKRTSKETEKLDHDAENSIVFVLIIMVLFDSKKLEMHRCGRRCAEKDTLLPQ
jgi:hypothetical protein